VPENCAETRPSLPVGTRLEGVPPTSHGYWYSFRRSAAKYLVQSRRFAVYFTKLGSQNGNPGFMRPLGCEHEIP
jgi:hypothetical protein